MYYLDGNTEYLNIHPKDLWVYNKLQLSRILGYTCGPSGTNVPKSDFYIVRPAINFLGMSIHARIEWIENSTDNFHPAEFWCEIFKGEHLSVDFRNQTSELVVKGTRKSESPLYKWEKWQKIDRKIGFPPILSDLYGNYEWINCEFIDNHLIEVQIRQNPDFRHGNSIAIPLWNDQKVENLDNFEYIEDSDYLRKGFYIK